ncbi:hypothetical protein C5B94_09120 [Clavibacter michiganensis]|uniref:restriction endonuclease subunit S n=1 Tax=Clavibacter michiganensis TaxID=28447 RepID=UPI000CE74648|nr:hypothetical protein [Clavibacter michiganensis]PPF53916.1 hypothetical protein C5B94_09120 [Clavibacter michiganensis]
MTLKTTVELLQLTWGDLIAFADLGRAAGKSGDDPVEQVPAQQDPDEVDAFALDLPATRLRVPAPFPADEAQRFIDALDRIDDEQGDARGELAMLRELRDRLAAM